MCSSKGNTQLAKDWMETTVSRHYLVNEWEKCCWESSALIQFDIDLSNERGRVSFSTKYEYVKTTRSLSNHHDAEGLVEEMASPKCRLMIELIILKYVTLAEKAKSTVKKKQSLILETYKY